MGINAYEIEDYTLFLKVKYGKLTVIIMMKKELMPGALVRSLTI